MKKRKEKSFILENIQIETIAAEGKSIARYQDKVIFVDGVAAPGDIADLKITKQRKNYMEGTPILFHKLSDLRIQPFCEHFGTCGGCKWQHIPYEKQLNFKHQQVIDNLQRIAKVALPTIEPILASQKTTFYRNKLDYSFSNTRWLLPDEIQSEEEMDRRALGFHIPGRFDKILDIKNCYLQEEPSNRIRLAAKKYAIENNFVFFNALRNVGFIRNLIIRTSSIGEIMVILQFYENRTHEIEKMMSFMADQFPEITSLNYVINPKGNDTFNDLEIVTFAGKDHIIEKMEDLSFRVGPKSFFQTNSSQAYELYQITRKYAGLQETDVVYDLYTGTGTIALFIAKNVKKVIGIEYVEMAVQDAKTNAKLNHITNADFFAGDMKILLNEDFISKHGKPDVVITDPPRAGMDPAVIEVLLKANPKKIVYVSCNPATQARDLALLDAQYSLQAVQPVDMFPHTHHVENVVLLVRRDS